MKSIYTLLFLLTFFIVSLNSYAQTITTKGKEFWMGFMAHHLEDGSPPVLALYITSDKPTSGIVEIPGAGYSQSFNVSTDSVTTINIPYYMAHVTTSETIEKRGVHIISDDSIRVVAYNSKIGSADASVILPVEAIGYEYYAMAYQPLISEFLVIAVYDHTEITITPSAPTQGGKPKNVPFTVELQKGEVYQVRVENSLATSIYDLTGTKIQSSRNCKPIAAFSGGDAALIPKSAGNPDHLYDQLYPLHTWGKEYLTVPLKTRKGDTFRILAAYDNTIFKINEGLPDTLQSSQFFEIILREPSSIIADKPISVAQFSNGGAFDSITHADPFMMVLLPLEQTINQALFSAGGGYTVDHYITIISRTSDVFSVKLDGNTISSSFNSFPSNSLYSYAQITLALNNPLVNRHTITSDGGMNVYVYGFGYYESYGYSAGAGFRSLTADFTYSQPTCAGDSINFNSQLGYTPLSYYWNFGDGNVSNEQNPSHIFTSSGTYTVSLKVQKDTCAIDSISKPIIVNELTKANAGRDTLICLGDSVQLNASGGSTYNWFPVEGLNNPNVSNPIAKPTTTTLYAVSVSDSLCLKVAKDTVVVLVNDTLPPVNMSAGPDVTICAGDSVQLQATGGSRYSWSPGTGLSNSAISNPFAKPDSTTRYIVSVSNGTCSGIAYDTVVVFVLSDLVSPQINDTIVCKNQSFTLNAVPSIVGGTISWWDSISRGNLLADSTESFTTGPLSVTTIYYTQTDMANCHSLRKSIKVTVIDPLPTPVLQCDSLSPDKIGFYWEKIKEASGYKISVDDGVHWVSPSSGTTVNDTFHIAKNILPFVPVTLITKAESQWPCANSPESNTIICSLATPIFENEYLLNIPNAFSPNNDGINDEFIVYGNRLKEYHLNIYDRWGGKVFSSNSLDETWNGYFENNSHTLFMPQGIYVFSAIVKDSKGIVHNYKGTLSLTR